VSTNANSTDHQLVEFRTLIEQRSGIWFDSSRERFFSSRIREHLQQKGLRSGAELMQLVRTSNVEYDALLQQLLTHETSFFRYPSVFEALKKRVLPDLHVKKFWKNPRTLRIWSAGCATGEEPYSVAITVAESLAFAEAWDVQILATDISRQALARATRGLYSQRNLGHLTPEQKAAHFVAVGDQFEIRPKIRSLISFASMNLAEGVYLGRMDCIFCMNVLMYFSEERRNTLIQRFYDCLEPGGYLLLGHSESLLKVPVKFEKIIFDDCLLYRKPGGENGTAPSAILRSDL
jgi:chemotaxis protein methyltransferase CheR